MKLRFFALAALAVAGALAGCDWLPSLGPPSKLVCPKVRLAPELDRLVALGAGGEVVATAKLGPVSATCKEGERTIIVNAELKVSATRIGAGQVPQLNYFFAVSDASRTVLNEADFGWVPNLASDRSDGRTDKMTIKVPTYDPATGGNFDIFIGFRLTPEQLQYNRAHPGS